MRNLTKKQQEKFNKQMESYREGITEDLKSGRHISAIIQGYGFIYVEEFNRAKDWIANNIKIANGYICMSCGKTNSDGTNKDGECDECVKREEFSPQFLAMENGIKRRDM